MPSMLDNFSQDQVRGDGRKRKGWRGRLLAPNMWGADSGRGRAIGLCQQLLSLEDAGQSTTDPSGSFIKTKKKHPKCLLALLDLQGCQYHEGALGAPDRCQLHRLQPSLAFLLVPCVVSCHKGKEGKTEGVCAASQVPPASWHCEPMLKPEGTRNPHDYLHFADVLHCDVQKQTW